MPVLYTSRFPKGAKRQYSVTDLGVIAVVYAMKTFRLYVMGTHFKVLTDHNVLKTFANKATLKDWFSLLGGFSYGFHS